MTYMGGIDHQKEFASLIGQAVIDFEAMNDATLNAITRALYTNGLKDLTISEILLSKITADQARLLLKNIVEHTIEATTEEKRTINIIFNELDKLIEQRNGLVHSTWLYMFQLRDEEPPKATHYGERYSTSKKNGTIKRVVHDQESINLFCKSCDRLRCALGALSRAIEGRNKVSELLMITDGKVEVIPENMIKQLPMDG